VKVVRHWRPYLWGRSFLIRTDHFALKYILDQRLTTIPQHTWVSKLFGYDFFVEYRQGKLNVVADALSRRDEATMESHALSSPSFASYNTLRNELSMHPRALQLRAQLAEEIAPEGWSEVEGILMYQGRAFLPDESTLWPQILEHAHTMGHEGGEKHSTGFVHSFTVHQHDAECVNLFGGCPVCQRNKTEHLHPAGLLQPLPVPRQVWDNIAMDFIEGFPKVGGKSVVLTVVDRFSKFAHFIPLSYPYSATTVAKAFFDNIVRLHGMPCSIVSDRDPVFTSTFWKELFRLAGVKLLLNSAFHPQTDDR
jgi:hypothetical protein